MKVVIFGGCGFIGSHLARLAAESGHGVLALCRSERSPDSGISTVRWQLGDPLPPSVSAVGACAIHLAHDFDGETGARRTHEGILRVARELHLAGATRQIFFSSYSAGEHATSLYGRTKLGIERALAALPDLIIVRPGLVLGDAGIYGRIRGWARRLPIVPLPDGGRGRVPVIEVERLCCETLALVEATHPPREANLFEPALKSLRQLVVEAAAETGRRPWILPVPTSLLVAGLRVGEVLRISLPVNADNLAGFCANQVACHRSTLLDH